MVGDERERRGEIVCVCSLLPDGRQPWTALAHGRVPMRGKWPPRVYSTGLIHFRVRDEERWQFLHLRMLVIVMSDMDLLHRLRF